MKDSRPTSRDIARLAGVGVALLLARHGAPHVAHPIVRDICAGRKLVALGLTLSLVRLRGRPRRQLSAAQQEAAGRALEQLAENQGDGA